MPIIRWDPFGELARFGEELERFWPFEKREKRLSLWSPKVDIKETDKEFSIKADIPGMEMKDISVCVDEGRLFISGERKLEKEEKTKDFVRVEREYGSFNRYFTLGVPVNEKNIRASYKDGVLEVVLPKAEVREAKKIEIQSK